MQQLLQVLLHQAAMQALQGRAVGCVMLGGRSGAAVGGTPGTLCHLWNCGSWSSLSGISWICMQSGAHMMAME